MHAEIRHDPDHNRFVARTQNDLATLEYSRLDADTLDFEHTFVPDEARGEGLGEELVRHGLAWARELGFKVEPSCPFVRHVLEENPELAEAAPVA